MLRGRIPAKIDDKGRLKVPSAFRAHIEEKFGSAVYLTSLSPNGEFVRLYPLPVWEDIEGKLRALPTMHPSRRAFEMTTSYWGQEAEIDSQGRILVPPALRDAAGLAADVAIVGMQTCLDFWSDDRIRSRIQDQGLTNEHLSDLAALGI